MHVGETNQILVHLTALDRPEAIVHLRCVVLCRLAGCAGLIWIVVIRRNDSNTSRRVEEVVVVAAIQALRGSAGVNHSDVRIVAVVRDVLVNRLQLSCVCGFNHLLHSVSVS